jgi:hypothetical protein
MAEFGPVGNGIESFTGGYVSRHSARLEGCGVVCQMLAEFTENFFFPASYEPQLAQALLKILPVILHG